MKRFSCLVLSLLLLVGLCACGNGGSTKTTEPSKEGAFEVGLYYADVTPKLGKHTVGLRGFGDTETRIAKDILSYLYASCLALRDADGETALVISLDFSSMENKTFDQVRKAISDATGVPSENIVVSCTHQHSSPEPNSDEAYAKYMLEKIAEGAKLAIEDLSPATMEITTIKTEGLNFVRHYKMKDGTYYGDNFGSTASGFEGHTSEPDPVMQLVKISRDGKNPILVTNYQGHPHLGAMEYYTSIHADTVGVYRDTVKEKLGYDVVYFSGASGNIKMKSAIEEENQTTDFREHGKLLAKYAEQAEGTYTAISGGKVKAIETTYVATVDHSNDHLQSIAETVYAAFKKTGSNAEAMKLVGADSGLSSAHHAGAILSIIKMGETSDIEHMGAISAGDLAFIAAPYEMFDQNGVFIKEKSPFKMTIITTIANSRYGYIPSEFTYSYGGYEVDTSKYVRGTAEELADQFVDMLNQLHGQ